MTTTRKGLGKGFGALVDPNRGRELAAPAVKSELSAGDSFSCPIDKIAPNPHQPRTRFDQEALAALALSVKRDGILQPLAVRRDGKQGDHYELIAGERRLRAAKKAGLSEVPSILIETDEEGLSLLALVENLMREDLNVLDEAEAYQELIDSFDLTQQQIAERVGRSREHVANTLRLLKLPEMVRAYIAGGELSAGHGRAILALDDDVERIALAQEVLARQLSVRETEALVKKTARALKQLKAHKPPRHKEHPYGHLADTLRERLGTKVSLKGGKQKGTVEIHYFSEEELTRIIDLLTS